MTNSLAIARRELASYYGSFLFYVITAAFLVITGFFFAINVAYSRSANVAPLFQTTYTILLLVAPILTMRLIAEEQRTGTIELVLTSPVRDVELVVGKFLGGMGLLVSMLVLTGFYPLLLSMYGNPDRGGIIGGYLGALLFGGSAVAIGVLTSSLTANQIVAAVLSFAVLLILWVIDGLGSIFGGTIGTLTSYLAVYSHFVDMTQGVIDTKDVVYFLSVILGALFLATLSIESRRWR
ncbi:MAG TPA: ABC transporter permease [Chloroflexota bacterium]|jgi:ABC-2 type transport system permease protein|nr:ABC transporter permease [Chloroflexota bacterium]